MLPSRRRDTGSANAARAFSNESPPRACSGVGSRQENTSNQKSEPRFDSIETERALGMIQQVEVRQQVHGEIAAKRSVAVAAVTTDSGKLDRALIELDVVALMSFGR